VRAAELSRWVVAIFRLQIRSLGRSAGRKAVNSAAYRAGERIRDERTGIVYDHSKRKDILHSEIVLPSGLEGRALPWAQTRAALWNLAEHAELRRNARVAREYEVALPAELTPEQRVNLTMAFAREISERYRVVVDTTVHAPRPGSDQRNYHAHLLSTTREATIEGLGRKSIPEQRDARRRQSGLLRAREEFKFLRERWATLTNEALRQAGLDARIDHRSLEAQGIDREPRPLFPQGAYRQERRGLHSEIADRIRERYRERVAARAARAAQREVRTGAQHEAPNGLDGRRGPSLEEVRRTAREAWVQFRAKAREDSAVAQKGTALEKTLELDAGL
jgi:hypothetical protein